MTTATAAAEYKSNIGQDITLADALDPEYLDEEAAGVEDELAGPGKDRADCGAARADGLRRARGGAGPGRAHQGRGGHAAGKDQFSAAVDDGGIKGRAAGGHHEIEDESGPAADAGPLYTTEG